MSEHTKGPWTLQEHEDEPCQLIGNGTIHIADIYYTDFPAGAADARLISAAPELLAACKMLFELAEMKGRHRVEDETFRVGKAVPEERRLEWEIRTTRNIVAQLNLEEKIEKAAFVAIAKAVQS